MDDSKCRLTNNAVERVSSNYIFMRMCSYVIRSYRGGLLRERMFSLYETVKLKQISAYNWLREIVEQHLLNIDDKVSKCLSWVDVNN